MDGNSALQTTGDGRDPWMTFQTRLQSLRSLNAARELAAEKIPDDSASWFYYRNFRAFLKDLKTPEDATAMEALYYLRLARRLEHAGELSRNKLLQVEAELRDWGLLA